ncbi:fructose-bisphosphate aldolase [Xylariales sp. AK1849]|nr:fructose-bisphosphate aldolase [Xylariales sp. AK1849]
MATSEFPSNNRTWQILTAAQRGGYAVGAFDCYNNDGVMAVIRAAEQKRSPAIIQLFPWTLHFQGRHFVDYVVAAAHGAIVPITVYLDHCIKDSDVELLGRIEGGEDGLATVDMETLLTEPADASEFVRRTGVHFLAPSFGNVHGPYPEGGAARFWQLDRLLEISKATGVPLVLHGTHPISDELFRKAISCGVVKINLNRTVRDKYTPFVTAHAGSLELTELKEKSVEVYTKSIERMMDVLGSSGKV